MRLTIYRGTKEIGGSCAVVSTASTRIVLDVGLPLVKPNREPFDPKVIHGRTAEELIAEGIIPNVPGLFTNEDSPQAILLSHSHLDHAGLLHLTNSEIPIYATSGTSKMMLAGAVFSRQKELDRSRYREAQSRRPFRVGDFTVTPFAVDHSSFGSVAYLLEAQGQTLLYSGDIRKHGRKPGMARDLVAAIGPRNIHALLMEGTHFGSRRGKRLTEFELEREIVGHIQSASGVVLACFSPIDVDRLVTYYRASQRTGRIFVVDAYAAFVMHLVASEASIPRPTREAGVRVYFNRAFENRQLTSVQERFQPDRISLEQILAEPTKYLMVFRPSMAELDFNTTLPTNSRCIYSYWKGYLEKPDWVQLQDRLKQVGGDFIAAHASGHIYVDDLVEFVRSINPRQVIPMHTFEPTAVQQHFDNVRLLDDGESYTIEE